MSLLISSSGRTINTASSYVLALITSAIIVTLRLLVTLQIFRRPEMAVATDNAINPWFQVTLIVCGRDTVLIAANHRGTMDDIFTAAFNEFWWRP
jgi:hypothetical protein